MLLGEGGSIPALVQWDSRVEMQGCSARSVLLPPGAPDEQRFLRLDSASAAAAARTHARTRWLT